MSADHSYRTRCARCSQNLPLRGARGYRVGKGPVLYVHAACVPANYVPQLAPRKSRAKGAQQPGTP